MLNRLEQTEQQLNDIISMLDREFPNETKSEDQNQRISLMSDYVRKLLEQGVVAIKTINGFTPLMLYAFYNIADHRLYNECAKGREHVTQVIEMKEYPHLKFSALTFATVASNITVLDILYKTKYFTRKHVEEAVYHASFSGQAKSVAYLREAHVNLFGYVASNKMTSLHIACFYQYPDVVKEILASNPSDELITLKEKSANLTAYDLACQNDGKCGEEFKDTKVAAWHNLSEAIANKDATALKNLFEAYAKFNFAIGYYSQRFESLIGMAASLATTEQDAENIYSIVENHLSLMPNPSDQINALLIGLSYWEGTISRASQSNPIYFDRMMSALSKLECHFTKMTILNINGLILNKEIWTEIMKIIKENSLREIDFVMTEGENQLTNLDQLSEQEQGEQHNLRTNKIADFVFGLLINTTLVKCNFETNIMHQPFKVLLEKIMERNQVIAQAKSAIVEEHIYNQYVPEINRLLKNISENPQLKTDNGNEDAEKNCVKQISIKNSMHTLTDLAAFRISNTPYLSNLITCSKIPEMKNSEVKLVTESGESKNINNEQKTSTYAPGMFNNSLKNSLEETVLSTTGISRNP